MAIDGNCLIRSSSEFKFAKRDRRSDRNEEENAMEQTAWPLTASEGARGAHTDRTLRCGNYSALPGRPTRGSLRYNTLMTRLQNGALAASPTKLRWELELARSMLPRCYP